MNFQNIFDAMRKDARFSSDQGHLELRLREEDAGPAIDYHGVGEFQLVAGDTKLGIFCPVTTKACDFVAFLEEHSVKEYYEVTLFWDGPDEFKLIEFDERREIVSSYRLKELLKRLTDAEVNGHPRIS